MLVEAVAVLWLVGAVGTVSVDQAGLRIGEVAMPNLGRAFGKGEAFNLATAGRVEKTQLYAFGVG